MWKIAAGLFVSMVLVGACGGGDGDDEGTEASTETTSDAGAAGALEAELDDGSSLRVRLDVDPSDPAVEPFEELRVLANADGVTWILGEIEVPEGAGGTGRFVSFAEAGADPFGDDPSDDTDGVTNAEFACSLIDDWAAASEDPGAADMYLELFEGPCGSQTLQVLAPAGEATTYVMVYEGELPDYERVFAGLDVELR